MNRIIAWLILSVVAATSTGLAADSALYENAKAGGKLVAYLAMNAADEVTVQTRFVKKFPPIKELEES